MNLRRLAIYLLLLFALAVLGFALVLWALYACAPPALPGDETWTFRRDIADAVSLIIRAGSATCFEASPFAGFALWLGARTAGALLAVLALIVIWETLGRQLRRSYYASRGGHVIAAGTAPDLAPLIAAHGTRFSTFFVAPDRQAFTELGRLRPFAEIVVAAQRGLAGQLAKLGAGKAKLIAAVTPSDLSNVAIAEAALAGAGNGEVLLRLEQESVRSLSAHRLSQQAEMSGRAFAVVSLNQLQSRRGMLAAMYGRYTLESDPRWHVAVCGTGPGLQTAATEFVRQGLGLERERPLLSILRTGSSDFAAGMLERLQTSIAVETRVGTASAIGGIDRAIGDIVAEPVPLRAVHCIGANAAESEALALRWEEVLLRLRRPVPPIVAYADEDRSLGITGMVRLAAASNLAEARDLAHLTEERARAVHERFLSAQRERRGPAFGTAPAEVPWRDLSESFREDNRAVTTQMDDIKLARVFMLTREGGTSDEMTTGEIETLAEVAHARWMAARSLAGWTFGDKRDNDRLLHPDLIPYADLDEAGKQKDRDEVLTMPGMAGLAGRALVREWRVAIEGPFEGAAFDRLVAELSDPPKDDIAVAVLVLDSLETLGLATRLMEAGVQIEAVLGEASDRLRETAPAERARVLRGAWRIHRGTGDPSHIAGHADRNGAIHAR